MKQSQKDELRRGLIQLEDELERLRAVLSDCAVTVVQAPPTTGNGMPPPPEDNPLLFMPGTMDIADRVERLERLQRRARDIPLPPEGCHPATAKTQTDPTEAASWMQGWEGCQCPVCEERREA